MSVTLEEWERTVRKDGLIPQSRERHKGYDIYVAASHALRPADGFYSHEHHKTAWAVGADGTLDMGSNLAFDALHDPSMETTSRAQARVNSALTNARDYIDKNKVSGRYDG